MLVLRDENWTKNILERFLEPGESLASIGKAMRKGYSYYTGFTDRRAIFLMNLESIKEPAFIVPLNELEPFVRRKRIDLLPFSSPFILGEKANRTFERLQQIVESRGDEGGHLRTIARAEYRLTHYCLAFYKDKIIAIEITRRSTEITKNQNYEVIPFPDIVSFYASSKNGEVSLDVPFHASPQFITMMLENGDTRLYGITTISGLGGPAVGIA